MRELPDPTGTGLALNTNTLAVLCPARDRLSVKCVAWLFRDVKRCRYYNGLCRLAHPETGSTDPEKYTVGVDCLFKTAKGDL